MSSHIPPEVISDILVRLPVEPLLRFRSISKPWCALIDSPDFIKLHLKHSITTKSNRSVYLVGNGTLFSLHYLDEKMGSFKTAIKFEMPFEGSVFAGVAGSCNGLLLLQNYPDIALFNPATREYRVLPTSPMEYHSGPGTRSPPKFGIGYDSVNDDYKVIKVVEFKGEGFRWIGSVAQIYSLKTNSWRKIDNFPYWSPCKRIWGVYLEGRLHIVVNATCEIASREIIVAFDLVTEKCHDILLPDGFDKSYFEIIVVVFEGMLCVQATYYSTYRIDIWLMRVYGVKESWFKLLSVTPPAGNTIHPLALSRNGEEVLLDYTNEELLFEYDSEEDYDGIKMLIWYNIEQKSTRPAPVRGFNGPFFVEVCVDSLFHLDDAGKSVHAKKEIKVKRKEVQDEKLKEKKHKKRDDFLSTGFKLKL